MKSLLLVFALVGAVTMEEDLKEYHESNLQFASAIYKTFSSDHEGNFLICPLSAQTILALMAIGTKEQTAQEITSALYLPLDPAKIEHLFKQISPYLDVDKDYQLTSANKIYVSEDIKLKNDFKSIAQNTFKSDVQNINFNDKITAKNEINKWVEKKTQEKIKNLLSESTIKPNTVAILINAVYFKGNWVNKFGEAYPMSFYVSKTDTVEVPMMTQREDFNYYFDKTMNAEFMEFPFVGDDVVMTIALPKEKDGLSKLEKSISAVLSEKPYQKLDSVVLIPKFTIESSINFKSILESLGAKSMFADTANLSGLSDASLKVDEVVQKTFIEISEEGAIAAAATEISLMAISMPRVNFVADHPFIYYLKHKVHGVVFVGRYVKP